LRLLEKSTCEDRRGLSKNFDELKDSILFNFECPSCDYFLVATGEKFFFAKHSPRAVEIAIEIAKVVDES